VTSTALLVLEGPADDVPGLCARLHAILAASGARTVVCDVRAVAADLRWVDALLRLQLAAGRCGARIRLYGASRELEELLAFVGVTDVVENQPACA
jgi:hypothetical protein